MKGNELPPDVIANIVEILGYFATAAIGWITAWFRGKKKEQQLTGEKQELVRLLNNKRERQ